MSYHFTMVLYHCINAPLLEWRESLFPLCTTHSPNVLNIYFFPRTSSFNLCLYLLFFLGLYMSPWGPQKMITFWLILCCTKYYTHKIARPEKIHSHKTHTSDYIWEEKGMILGVVIKWDFNFFYNICCFSRKQILRKCGENKDICYVILQKNLNLNKMLLVKKKITFTFYFLYPHSQQLWLWALLLH